MAPNCTHLSHICFIRYRKYRSRTYLYLWLYLRQLHHPYCWNAGSPSSLIADATVSVPHWSYACAAAAATVAYGGDGCGGVDDDVAGWCC